MNMNNLKEWMDFANRCSGGDFWKEVVEPNDQACPPESSDRSDFQWIPSADVITSKNETFILVELPGIRREDFELIISTTQFILKGVKPNRMLGLSYVTNESYYGPFERIIPFPHPVNIETVFARLAEGILMIRFSAPLVKEAKISVL